MTDPTPNPLAPIDDTPPALDAHGFDPAAYDWIPVRRVPRSDGWSPEKQRLFISELADTGSVTEAAYAVGMSTKSAYALRRAPDGAGFARAWAAAIRQGMDRLVDVCLERAMEGSEIPIFDRNGSCIGHRKVQHDRLAMFLLRAHMPELFRDAHRADRARGEALPLPPEPVAEAVKAIDPVPPAEPHALMPPDELECALQVADLLPGELPRWHRDPTLMPVPEQPALDEQVERELKAGTWRPPATRRERRKQRRR
jgi:hypothetical protein